MLRRGRRGGRRRRDSGGWKRGVVAVGKERSGKGGKGDVVWAGGAAILPPSAAGRSGVRGVQPAGRALAWMGRQGREARG